MYKDYQVRWTSKDRFQTLRRSVRPGQAVLLESMKGFLVVEPVGSDLGDGPLLTPEEAEYELQPVWCTGPMSKLNEARRRLGLPTGGAVGAV
jgi:hypothetical protein